MANGYIPTREEIAAMQAQEAQARNLDAMNAEMAREKEAINYGFNNSQEMDAYMANNMPIQSDAPLGVPQVQARPIDDVVSPETAAYARAMGRVPGEVPTQAPDPTLANAAKNRVAELFANIKGY